MKTFKIQILGEDKEIMEQAASYYITDGIAIFLNDDGAVTCTIPAHAAYISEVLPVKNKTL